MNQDYVDVRGPWPMYVSGVVAVPLEGKPRDISVEDARVVAKHLLASSVTFRK